MTKQQLSPFMKVIYTKDMVLIQKTNYKWSILLFITLIFSFDLKGEDFVSFCRDLKNQSEAEQLIIDQLRKNYGFFCGEAYEGFLVEHSGIEPLAGRPRLMTASNKVSQLCPL